MFGPESLTQVVYVLLVLAAIAIATYVVLYHLHMRAKLREAERAGAHPHSLEEGILIGLEQAATDKRRHAHHHA